MKVYDLDQLNLSSTLLNLGVDGNVFIDVLNFKIYLKPLNDLNSIEGVSHTALFAFIKKAWKDNSFLIKEIFPIEQITSEQFEYKAGWSLGDQETIDLIRDGGFSVRDQNGLITQESPCIIILNGLENIEQIYWIQEDRDSDVVNIRKTGNINLCIPLYGHNRSSLTFDSVNKTITSTVEFNEAFKIGLYVDISNSISNNNSFKIVDISVDRLAITVQEILTDETTDCDVIIDSRKDFKTYVRTFERTYTQTSVSEIGSLKLTFKSYILPLNTNNDGKITHLDSYISSNTPYTNMTITWYDTPQIRSIDSVDYYFDIIIDGGTSPIPSKEEIYEFVQYSLRQTYDIDSGVNTHIGNKTNELLEFSGDVLITSNGVYIDNINPADLGNIIFKDIDGTSLQHPFTASGKIVFGQELIQDTDSWYKMYFTDANNNLYGTENAIIVKDKNGIDIGGLLNSASEISFTFDYDYNSQGGRIPATDASITVVCSGLNGSQPIVTTGVISRTNSNSIIINSLKELTYSQ